MKIYAIIVLLSLLCARSVAQEAGIATYFEDSVIIAEPGKSFTNFLIVENKSSRAQKIDSIFPRAAFPGLLLFPRQGFLLEKGEKKRLPLKWVATHELLKQKDSLPQFHVVYDSGDTKQTRSVHFRLAVEEKKHISLHANPLVQYLKPGSPENEVTLVIENPSYSVRTLKITLEAHPGGLHIETPPENVQLAAREKKVITCKIALSGKRTAYPNFQVLIKATDILRNETVGSTSVQLITLSSNTQMVPALGSLSDENFLEATFNQIQPNSQMLHVQGNTRFRAGKQINARINTAADMYTNHHTYQVYDTWAEFERKQSVLRIGNLYADGYDHTVSGKGFRTSLVDSRENVVEVLALEEDYQILGNHLRRGKGSKIVAAKFQARNAGNETGKISYLFENDPQRQVQTQLLHGNTGLRIDSVHHVDVVSGISFEKARQSGEQHFGAKGGIVYQGQVKRWHLQSANMYSSAHYAGTTRGSLQIHNTANYQFTPNRGFLLRYEWAQLQPGYLRTYKPGWNSLDSFYFPGYAYSRQNIQTGYRMGFNKLGVLLSPRLLTQSTNQTDFTDRLLSYRFQTDLSLSGERNGVHLSFEYGYSQSESKQAWFSSFSSNASYRLKHFFFYASYQYNPLDINDLRYFTEQIVPFSAYTANASYSFAKAGNRLTGNVATGFTYSQLHQTSSKNAHANVNYRIDQGWSAIASGAVHYYETKGLFKANGFNHQFSLGVKKHFGQSTAANHHKVTLILFNDKNGDTRQDEEDEILQAESVWLNDHVAITDQKGRATFHNVPKGVYTLKIGQSTLSVEDEKQVVIDGNETLRMGVARYYRIRGSLREIQQAYDLQATNVTGIVVYAKDSLGNVISTVTDQNHEFEFFVKNGSYIIFIENNTFDFPERAQKVVANGSNIPEILFEYRKKNKDIKIKRF